MTHTHARYATLAALLPLVVSLLVACGGDASAPVDAGIDAGGLDAASPVDAAPSPRDVQIEGEDFEAQASDFGCILAWPMVRRFRITNTLGHLDEALAVAGSSTGGTYPVGTIIQLVPSEAMVKRGRGFSPETNDWEFFALDASASGTSIRARGTTTVVNAFGGNCFDCHRLAEPRWDFVCEDTHGCDPLPIGPDVLLSIQNGDPRCGAMP